MKISAQKISSGKSGFSLTEIALALLVIGVGMTAILAVFPIALNMGANSTQQARMMLLGEEILSELRVHAMDPKYSWDGSGNTIEQAINNGELDVSLPFAADWDTTGTGVDPKIEVKMLGQQQHQQIWYIEKQSGIDSHNIGVRVTVFPPSSGHYTNVQRGEALDVEVALWSQGTADDSKSYTIRLGDRERDFNAHVERSKWTRPGSRNSLFKVFDPDIRVYGEIRKNDLVLK